MGTMRVISAALAALALGIWAGSASGRASGWAQVASGFSSPVYVTSAPGDPGTLYVVEQPGTIKIVKNGQTTGTFLDIRDRVKSGGEQGLLSVAFSPQYQTNHKFYVDYSDTNGDTRVVEFTGDRNHSRQLLFVDQPYDNHNGGQLQFDSKGYLYVGMGDGGSGGDPGNRAQNLKSRLGKLLRINPTRAGSAWQIVGYGLRNPWRFSFDKRNGNLWIGDVGQNRYEEIDYRPAARVGRVANYGWSKYEGRAVYDGAKPYVHKGDVVWPVVTYSHSVGCSVTGGYVVNGRYYYGDYCSGTIWSFKAGSGRLSKPVPSGHIGNLSSFGVDGNNALYAVSTDGALYKLR
jgi:glucose/arabinose dehydrogenase